MDDQQEQSLRERLNGMFSRWNYVGISNPLKTAFDWKVALEQNELIGMSAGGMKEDDMIKNVSGTFLPRDAVTKSKTRVVPYTLQPGEKKMVIGEAAYILIDKLFRAYIKEKYVPAPAPGEMPSQFDAQRRKAGFAKLRNPVEQDKVLKLILVGPIINNVEDAVQTFVNDKMEEAFTDVQTTQEQASGGSKAKTTAKA
jgi:hypothetical protein